MPGTDRQSFASNSGRLVRASDGFVVRRSGWWTPAVHALLGYLERCAFPFSPRVAGTEGDCEVLTFIPGDSGPAGWAKVVPEDGLRAMARLLRAYHDAVAGFGPPEAQWATCRGAPGTGELICHGDFGPWNVVWRGAEPAGIIDWDLAGPRSPMHDIAYALEYCTPFRDDEECIRWLGYPGPPDRSRRLALFAEAYGLAPAASLVDEVLAEQVSAIRQVRMLAVAGIAPQLAWVSQGYLQELGRRVRWTRANRHLFAGT
jgi:Phosphotransferase enzyme family